MLQSPITSSTLMCPLHFLIQNKTKFIHFKSWNTAQKRLPWARPSAPKPEICLWRSLLVFSDCFQFKNAVYRLQHKHTVYCSNTTTKSEIFYKFFFPFCANMEKCAWTRRFNPTVHVRTRGGKTKTMTVILAIPIAIMDTGRCKSACWRVGSVEKKRQPMAWEGT